MATSGRSRAGALAPVAASVRTMLLALGAVLLGSGLAGPAAAQCTLVSGPNKITCPDTEGACWSAIWLNLRPYTISRVYRNGASGQDRIAIPLNYGHAVYSLASPASPRFLAIDDIRNPPVGPITKDGQSFIAAAPGVSSDGQRALLTMDVTGFGSTIVGAPKPDAFAPKGDTGNYRSTGGLVIQKTAGGRYIGYGLTSTGRLWASDITTLPSSFTVGNMDSELAFSGFTSGANYLQLAEGNGYQYLYWLSSSTGGATVVVADARNPGPSGAITAGYPVWTVPYADWGRPAGDVLAYVSAAVDPRSASGRLYLLGVFRSSSATYSFALRSFESATGETTPAGSFAPDPSFARNAGARPALAVSNPYNDDVDIYMWTAAAGPTGNGPKGILRLYATSARFFGSTISQTVDLDMNSLATPQAVSDLSILRKSDTNVYAYLTDGTTPYAVQLRCLTAPAPAVSLLAVSDISGGAPIPLANDVVVFVGDTLRITPSVLPSSGITPIDQWNLDLNYHALQETASGLLQLHTPDATGSGDPSPAQFTLIGPCDRNFASANPATGAGCWASVTPPSGNGTYGGPDFATGSPAGTSTTLPIAFEAKNSLNDTQSPPNLARFQITWRVPAVRPLGLTGGVVSAFLNASNAATFQDASEGHPVSFKWYFGSTSGAPQPETLNLDSACTGPSCSHTFSGGNGTYNAFLAASYKGGYSSPDCGPPCTLPRAGSFVVDVTGFIPSFTASPTVTIGGSPISVTNQSQIGQGITPSYGYTLCDASAGSCPDATYTQLVGGGPWTIPAPSRAGTWWLRIRATYGSGPTTVQWLPNVGGVSDPSGWPVQVLEQPAVLKPTGSPGVDGWNWCTVGCGSIVYIGTVGTPLIVAVFRGAVQQTGMYDWATSGACAIPGAATGARTFSLTPLKAGTLTVSNATLGITLKIQISGSLKVTAPSPVGAGSANVVASVPNHSGSTYVWVVTNGTITAGQGTSQITLTAGVAGTPLTLAVTETTADSCQTSGSTSLTVTRGVSALRFYTVTPCRMLDTRTSSPVAPGGTLTVTLAGAPCGIPSGATSVSANITVAEASASGYLTIYPADGALPVTSSINFKAGQARANNAILLLSGDGTGRVKVYGGATGTLHVVIDVSGYFQ